jgi:DNA-binding response OmpR family regulator
MSETRIILVVEDSASDEMLILRALKVAHLPDGVFVVRDGQQALDYVFREGEFAGRPEGEAPAVIVLDIGLPRVNGLDVLQRLRADPRTRLIPVVLLTSSDDERDMLRGYECGANSYVCKPLDFESFAERIARLGAYWLAVNEPPPAPRRP